MTVMIYDSPEGGELEFPEGEIAFDSTPATQIYLSLFGGSAEDNGSSATQTKQWWGNYAVAEPDQQLRSRTQAILQGLPASTGNVQLVTEAAEADLAWFVGAGLAEAVGVRVTLPALRRVRIEVTFAGGKIGDYRYTTDQPWGPR